MTLASGTHLGPYEILSRVGAGGMGEVFRARDTRLDRTVAVKVLPAELAHNAQLRLRFQREARAISALGHPNICALYDVGEHDGVDFLVMEYLEGESLADRLLRGPVPLKEALRIGVEIAAALERAHREGIVHRDLKPANVMLTKGGAKLLDFGLARSAAIEAATPFDATQQKPLTAEGTIVGTFQYMAPEQLEGQQVDQRTDLFAFGAMLYEMITGVRAFSGKTKTSLIASIVAGSPRPMSELQPVTPPELENLVQRCLDKDPDARWQSAHDVRLELEWIARQLDSPAARAQSRSRVPWIVAAIAIAIAGAASFIAWRATRARPAPPAIRAHLAPPPGRSFVQPDFYLSLSPDGRYMTFGVGDDERMWLRPLGSGESRPIEGTAFGGYPFWSPDSRSIAFFADGKLKKVGLDGAPPVVVTDAPDGRIGSWNRDGVILFSPTARSGIHRVSAAGGAAVPLTKIDDRLGETTHRWATFLPDGKHFLYLAGVHGEAIGSGRDAVYLTSLEAPLSRTLLLRVRSNVAYTAGHLLFMRDGELVAQQFDASRRSLSGDAFRVGSTPARDFFAGAFAAAGDGTLVYAPAPAAKDFHLSWWENGSVKEALRPAVLLQEFVVSPNEKSVAANVVDPQTGLADVWLFDLVRGASRRVTATPDATEDRLFFSRDGKSIFFCRVSPSRYDLVMADLGGATERIVFSDPKRSMAVSDVSPDGAWAVATSFDIGSSLSRQWLIPLRGNGELRPFARDPNATMGGTFSPDGQWIVYSSNSLARPQLRIARFPDAGHQTDLASEPAWYAHWINDGELLLTGPHGLRILPLNRDGNAWVTGTPRPARPNSPGPGDTVTNDGKRFLDRVQNPAAESRSVTLMTGWLKSP